MRRWIYIIRPEWINSAFTPGLPNTNTSLVDPCGTNPFCQKKNGYHVRTKETTIGHIFREEKAFFLAFPPDCIFFFSARNRRFGRVFSRPSGRLKPPSNRFTRTWLACHVDPVDDLVETMPRAFWRISPGGSWFWALGVSPTLFIFYEKKTPSRTPLLVGRGYHQVLVYWCLIFIFCQFVFKYKQVFGWVFFLTLSVYCCYSHHSYFGR